MTEIERHLAQLFDSAEFRRSPQLQRLLHFLITAVPRGTSPNQYMIATRGLGRQPSFTPESDPVVRVEMRRLRDRLERYYQQNPPGPVRIRIPKFRYEAVVESLASFPPRAAGSGAS